MAILSSGHISSPTRVSIRDQTTTWPFGVTATAGHPDVVVLLLTDERVDPSA